MRQKLIELQEEIDESSFRDGNFNNPLSERTDPDSAKIRQDIVEFNNTINQLDITDIYKLFIFSDPLFKNIHQDRLL